MYCYSSKILSIRQQQIQPKLKLKIYLSYQKIFLVVTANIENLDCVQQVSQLAFTCSKLTIETLEQGLKYAQS